MAMSRAFHTQPMTFKSHQAQPLASQGRMAQPLEHHSSQPQPQDIHAQPRGVATEPFAAMQQLLSANAQHSRLIDNVAQPWGFYTQPPGMPQTQHCPWTDVDIALNVCAVQVHAHCVRACQVTIGRCSQLAHRWCHMQSYACVQQHEHTRMCTAMNVTHMIESMQKIGRSKSKGERVHSQYNRLYWRDYQISLVDEGGQ